VELQVIILLKFYRSPLAFGLLQPVPGPPITEKYMLILSMIDRHGKAVTRQAN